MGGFAPSPIVWLLFTLLGVLIGVAIIILSRRARRIDDHPICRRCRFDLVGLADRLGDKGACPECGAALAAPRAIRIGNRRVHRPLLAVGVAVILLALLVGGARTALTLAGPQRMKYMPVWVLTLEARDGSIATSDRAMVELTRRERADELTPRQTDTILRLALERQADSTAFWTTSWGDFVDAAWAGGRVTPQDRAAYLLNGIAYSLSTRDRVRNGDAPAIMLAPHPSRLGATTTSAVSFKLHALSVGGAPVRGALEGRVSFTDPGGHSQWTTSSLRPLAAPVGEQMVHSTWKVVLDIEDDPTIPKLEREVTSSRRVTVLPPGTPLIQLIRDPETVRRAVAALSCTHITLPPDGKTASLDLTATDLRSTIATRMILLREPAPPPGREPRTWRIETQCIMNGSGGLRSSGWSAMPLTGDGPLDLDAVDIVLEPDVQIGEQRPDLDAILGEPVIIRNVPVKRQP